MGQRTERWKLSTLGPGDSIKDDGYKFSDADIHLIDRLLEYLVEQHRHTGTLGTGYAPDAGPSLELDTMGGAIPSGVRLYYRITVVDPDGFESEASPISSIEMPTSVIEPGAPSLSYVTGSGTLEPGQYTYVLSAYKDATTLETKAVNSAFITVPGTASTNEITLTMPSLPAGADGFNIYRRSPGGFHFLHLASTAAASYVDDGSVEPDCDRTIPAANLTSNTNLVIITYPGATPALEDGWSWRIYRTDDASNWDNSFLVEITPSGATPIAEITYEDVGESTRVGAPPDDSQVISAPEKIRLTDALEVQGYLPPGRNIVPFVATFVEPGTVTVGQKQFLWVCDYTQADIQYVRAFLGDGAMAAAQDVIVDVLCYRPSQGQYTWDSIFSDNQANMALILAGENFGEPSATPDIIHLEEGDALCIEVEQDGGGATQADENLTVNVLMLAQGGSTTTSHTWAV